MLIRNREMARSADARLAIGDRWSCCATPGSISVFDATKFQHLRQAVDDDDWILAADVCLEIALEARTPLDQSLAEELANAVRLRRAESVLDMIDRLANSDATGEQPLSSIA
jgi:hypothetical protein